MEQNQPENLITFFKALGDADRLKVAGLLAAQTLTLTELAQKLSLSPAETHKHLLRLEEMGLLVKSGEAYRLNEKALEGKARAVLAQSQSRPNPDAFEGDDFERKVLAGYILPGGALRQIPSQQKKLLVILAHLARQFSPTERYTEKQVNDMLRRFYDDTASLRRYLVDFGFMAREKGIYWRLEKP